MTKLPNITLILLGALWMFYASPWRTAKENAAVSDAMQLEADLKAWADRNASKDAVDEIYDDSYSLQLGGEIKSRNFRQMIEDTVANASVPTWPGLLAVAVGVGSLSPASARRDERAEQDAASNGG